MRLRSRTTLTAAISLATVLAAASAARTAAIPTKVPPRSTRLERTLKRFADAHPAFPGVALAVRAPGFSWSSAAGDADRATRKPLTPRAPFRIASVTKTFTAAAILRLVEDGKLGLDDAGATPPSPSPLPPPPPRGF